MTSFSTETATVDNLQAGDYPVRSVDLALISGQNLKRGTVLGKITASNKVTLSLAASSDGSEDVYGILAEDVDASSSDMNAIVYTTGDFNQAAMTFGSGHTADSTRDAFRVLGMHVRAGIPA